jgi:thioredoxin-like negative regulator of GroEL
VLHAFTAENFLDEVLNWDGLVVVDFWAETRTLCKVMLPVMQRLAQRYAGMPVKVGRVDVLTNAEFVDSLGIKAIPYIMVILRGDVAIEFIGDKTFEELEKAIAPFTSFARNGAAH